MPDLHIENKKGIHRKLMGLCAAVDLDSAAASVYTDDARCNAFHPVNEIAGRDTIVENLWRPIRNALPDVEPDRETLSDDHIVKKNLVGIKQDREEKEG